VLLQVCTHGGGFPIRCNWGSIACNYCRIKSGAVMPGLMLKSMSGSMAPWPSITRGAASSVRLLPWKLPCCGHALVA
jgi:hypothetical protein